MGIALYTLRKKAVIVADGRGGREPVYLLQLVVTNALSQDAQKMVDAAIRTAYRTWELTDAPPQRVVQVGSGGIPQPGLPIFQWIPGRRVYCFDDELLEPVGFLGEKEFGGYRLRSIAEQERLNDLATARGIDEGRARVYRDFWAGETFKSGAEYLAYRRGANVSQQEPQTRRGSARVRLHPRLAKILSLIQHIEFKGNDASPADIQYLSCLKQKASQLGHSFPGSF